MRRAALVDLTTGAFGTKPRDPPETTFNGTDSRLAYGPNVQAQPKCLGRKQFGEAGEIPWTFVTEPNSRIVGPMRLSRE